MEHNLEQYFSGDDDWNEFIKVFNDYWESVHRKNDLIAALNGNIGFAKAFSYMVDNPLDIIHEKMEMLDNLSPVDCLNNDVLETRLKAFLMRYSTK